MKPTKRVAGALALFAAAVLGAACLAGPDSQADGGKEQQGNPQAVAKVGDASITLEDVDREAMKAGIEPYQNLYDARRRALDAMIAKRLLESAAKARGITPEELMKEESTKRARVVTDENIDTFYGTNKERMGGRTLDEMRGQIRDYLQSLQVNEASQSYIAELRKAANVSIALDPPRVEVAVGANDPAKGPASAPVTIIEFSDFQCPYCSRVGPTLRQIEQAYGDKVRIVFRDFILQGHDQALGAAEAAQCAHEQGRFWDYHDVLFANQRLLGPDDLKRYATDLKLDSEKFNACLDGGKYRADVMSDHQEGQQAGVSGTPAFYVNGRYLSGAQPFEVFKQIIDEELAR